MIQVTDKKTPNVEDNSILIQDKFGAIPTPPNQLSSGVYYSWKGKWTDMWDKFITRAQALIDLNLSDYVPKTRTITINGDTKDLSADGSWAVSGGLVQSVSDTNTVDLTVDGLGDLTANVRHQDTATINLSEDASGLKADFSSMNISQFTNDSGYTTNTGTVTSVAALTLGTTGTDLSSTVANSTTTPVITLNVPTASASNRGALSSTDWSTFNNKIGGSGTTNEIAYFSGSSTLSSLSTATYPSLTELSYVKGVTSAVQTQINNRALVLLSTATASSSSSIDFEIDYTAYNKYIIEFTGVQSSVNYTDDLWLRVGTGSPVAYQSGANDYSWIRNNLSTSTSVSASNTASGAYSDTKIILDPFMNNTGVYSVSGSVVIYNPSNSTYHKNIEWTSTMRWITAASAIGTSKYSGSATYRAATAITGLRIMSSTGNILTGTFKIYGVA